MGFNCRLRVSSLLRITYARMRLQVTSDVIDSSQLFSITYVLSLKRSHNTLLCLPRSFIIWISSFICRLPTDVVVVLLCRTFSGRSIWQSLFRLTFPWNSYPVYNILITIWHKHRLYFIMSGATGRKIPRNAGSPYS